jgi:hypothetical protein
VCVCVCAAFDATSLLFIVPTHISLFLFHLFFIVSFSQGYELRQQHAKVIPLLEEAAAVDAELTVLNQVDSIANAFNYNYVYALLIS